MKKTIFTHATQPALIAASLLAASLVLSACQSTGGLAQAKVDASAEKVTVAAGTVENRTVATGKVAAHSTINIAFTQSGVVREVRVKEGQQVKAGDALAVLDAPISDSRLNSSMPITSARSLPTAPRSKAQRPAI